MPTANTAVNKPRYKLLPIQTENVSQSIHMLWLCTHRAWAMINKGKTKPSSTGMAHSSKTKAAGQPFSCKGCDSAPRPMLR